MTAAAAALEALAAFGAGALNAAAGGGSFLTLPALISVGLPAVAANATGTAALLPGYIGAAFGSRRDLRPLPGLSLAKILLLAGAGGVAGALLLLATPERLFRGVVPWLLLVATALFALPQRLLGVGRERGAAISALGVFAVCTYGGYFNGGLGILLLALFSALGLRSINSGNALKNVVSTMLTVIAVAVYAGGGAIRLLPALWMGAFATAGGYVGARLVRRLPALWLRAVVIAIGLTMTILLWR